VNHETQKPRWVDFHERYLAQGEAAALRRAVRCRRATRIALHALLAGAAMQLYMLHVYAAIAALPTLVVAGVK
jgi:hypothetical protein